MSNEHKKRLESRLEWEGFIESKIKSDGNCQFSSLADQLFRCPEYHDKVRERVVKQLKTCPKIYREFVEMDSSKKRTNDLPKDYSEYVKNMSKNGVWGDSVTLQAAADTFGVKIVVITSEKEVDSMEIVPKCLTLERVVYLSYLAGVHYNSIYLKGTETDAAPMELPGKSKNKNTNKSEDNKDMEHKGRMTRTRTTRR
ncbi:OTU domain-containing protein [Hirschfeldia incana]|nr:OTU domain-containing protein [Hirschfeldia incana]